MINTSDLVELAQACINAPWRTSALLEPHGIFVMTRHTPPDSTKTLGIDTMIAWRDFEQPEDVKRALTRHFEGMRRALDAQRGDHANG